MSGGDARRRRRGGPHPHKRFTARPCRQAAWLTTSPWRGGRVVWLQEKPKRLSPSIRRLMSVPLPTPEGPTMTRAEGVGGGAASAGTPPVELCDCPIVLVCQRMDWRVLEVRPCLWSWPCSPSCSHAARAMATRKHRQLGLRVLLECFEGGGMGLRCCRRRRQQREAGGQAPNQDARFCRWSSTRCTTTLEAALGGCGRRQRFGDLAPAFVSQRCCAGVAQEGTANSSVC